VLADIGNGFLLRQGYTIVWSGWQAQGRSGAQCCVESKPDMLHAELPYRQKVPAIIGQSETCLLVNSKAIHRIIKRTLSYPVLNQTSRRSCRCRPRRRKSHSIPFCVAGAKVLRCWVCRQQTIRISPGFDSGNSTK
jgi:hypothetical protein